MHQKTQKTALPVGKAVGSGLALAILAYQVPSLLAAAQLPDWNGYGAADYELYMMATRRWLAGGPFYEPYQLAGAYHITFGAILYPPVALWLFVPFTVLPAVLWWAVPIAVTGWCLYRLRPAPVAWPIMALCLWGPVQIHFVTGNPDLWSMMFVALGTLYRWPAVFAFFKPSVGWVGLFGARDRRWWWALGVFCLMSAAVLPMWSDWLRAILDSQGGGLAYSWQEAPIMLIPIVAWLARPGGRYDLARRPQQQVGTRAERPEDIAREPLITT